MSYIGSFCDQKNEMIKHKTTITITKYLKYLSIIAVLFAHLALTDISHDKEPDLTSEWLVVQVAFIIVIAFVVSVLVTFKKIKE
jgi:hypothetical protein